MADLPAIPQIVDCSRIPAAGCYLGAGGPLGSFDWPSSSLTWIPCSVADDDAVDLARMFVHQILS